MVGDSITGAFSETRVGNGTDAGSGWFRTLAVVCVAGVLAAVGWRLAPSFEGRGWTRHPRRTGA